MASGLAARLVIAAVAFAVMGLASQSWAQPGVGNNFGIEGDLFANTPGIAPFDVADDWLDAPGGPGVGVLNWDGTNHRGVPVRPGIYFIRLAIGGRGGVMAAFTRKTVVLR